MLKPPTTHIRLDLGQHIVTQPKIPIDQTTRRNRPVRQRSGQGGLIHHADLYGERETKYETLSETDIATTDWKRLEPKSPNYLFKPWNNELAGEYEQWHKITDIMPVNSVGVTTARNKLTIRWSQDEVMNVVSDFAHLQPEAARSKYNLGGDTQDWKVQQAQNDLKNNGTNPSLVKLILYRVFDTRYTYYTGNGRGFLGAAAVAPPTHPSKRTMNE